MLVGAFLKTIRVSSLAALIVGIFAFLYWFSLVNWTSGKVVDTENNALAGTEVTAALNGKDVGTWTTDGHGLFRPHFDPKNLSDVTACASLCGSFELKSKKNGYQPVSPITHVPFLSFHTGQVSLTMQRVPPPPVRSIDNSHFELQPGITVVLSTNMGSFHDRENYIKVFLNSNPVCEWNNRPSLPRKTYADDHTITNTDSGPQTYKIESRHKNRRPDGPPEEPGPDVFHDNAQNLTIINTPSQIGYEFHDGINPFSLSIRVR